MQCFMKFVLLVLFSLAACLTPAWAQDTTATIADEFLVDLTESSIPNLSAVKAEIYYPIPERALGEQGKVIVRVRFDAQGRYVSHEVLRASDASIAAIVEQHLPKLKCLLGSPALGDARYVVVIPFRYGDKFPGTIW